MIGFRACHLALVLWAVLVVIAFTARADTPPALTLYISDTIAEEDAASQAARHWAATLTPTLRSSIQSFNTFNTHAIPRDGIVLAPITQWSQEMPALDVLRLPFFYPDLAAVHRVIDGEPGKLLAQAGQSAGWKVLAIWDAGMTDFSGNQPYNRLPNLAGMQFALWEHDPLQETELRALDVWSRVVGERGVKRMAQECLVNSRSTTPLQMTREHLQRIHLDITLTRDRYEGYVLALPMTIWKHLSTQDRDRLQRLLASTTSWEREESARQQQQALAVLQKAGMAVHELNATQRQLYASRMLPWERFLPNMNETAAKQLIAAARTAAATGGRGGSGGEKSPVNSLPATQSAE